MTYKELKQFYTDNTDFHAYIDRFCRTGRYTVEEVLEKKVVEYVALQYMGRLRAEND